MFCVLNFVADEINTHTHTYAMRRHGKMIQKYKYEKPLDTLGAKRDDTRERINSNCS